MIDVTTFAILALAAFRLTHILVVDAIFDGIRTKIWSKYPPMTKIGYLITCFWCSGFWISIFLALSWLLLPEFTFVVSLILAMSALVGLISAWLER